MSYYMVAFTVLSAFTLSEADVIRDYSLKKGALKNFEKFLRTNFLQNTSEQMLFFFVKL